MRFCVTLVGLVYEPESWVMSLVYVSDSWIGAWLNWFMIHVSELGRVGTVIGSSSAIHNDRSWAQSWVLPVDVPVLSVGQCPPCRKLHDHVSGGGCCDRPHPLRAAAWAEWPATWLWVLFESEIGVFPVLCAFFSKDCAVLCLCEAATLIPVSLICGIGGIGYRCCMLYATCGMWHV